MARRYIFPSRFLNHTLTFIIACFNIATGDVEDAPALDPMAKFELVERDGAVYVKGEEAVIKASKRTLDITCKAQGSEKVVVIGGLVFCFPLKLQVLTLHCNTVAVALREQWKDYEAEVSRAPLLSYPGKPNNPSTARNFPRH